MEQLKNDRLTVSISSKGAEIVSIKNADGVEYLWDGDEKYWNRHSPILFPIVCGLWKNTYRIDGKEYHMNRHGFARDMEFSVESVSPYFVIYNLTYNEETLKVYPYKFKLSITYALCENSIAVKWEVSNIDDKVMHFQIGGHPAFIVPGNEKGKELHGKLSFDCANPTRLYGNEGGCLKETRDTVETTKGEKDANHWAFTEHSFDDDAVIIDHCQMHEIDILDEKDIPHVKVKFDAPCVGIWSPAGKHAPFVCIEPWYGVTDKAGFTGEFRDKYLMNSLLPGASFITGYSIELPKEHAHLSKNNLMNKLIDQFILNQ